MEGSKDGAPVLGTIVEGLKLAVVGLPLGAQLGAHVVGAIVVGRTLGHAVGTLVVGITEGTALGFVVGMKEGAADGT